MYRLKIGFKQAQNYSASLLKACMGIAFLICLLVPASTAFASTNSAHNSQSSSIASYTSDTTACAEVSNQNTYIHCVAPTMKSFCGPNQWYGPVSDGRTMIDWTYTYGSNKHCVTVTWNTANRLVNNSCHANMYIPAHNATASLSYQFHYGSKTDTSNTIFQANYTKGEFVDLGVVRKTLTSITVDDQNFSNAYRSTQIGWGTKANYSLKITCDRGR